MLPPLYLLQHLTKHIQNDPSLESCFSSSVLNVIKWHQLHPPQADSTLSPCIQWILKPVQQPHLSIFQTHLISLHLHNTDTWSISYLQYYSPLKQSAHGSHNDFSKKANTIRSLPNLKFFNGFSLPFGMSTNSSTWLRRLSLPSCSLCHVKFFSVITVTKLYNFQALEPSLLLTPTLLPLQIRLVQPLINTFSEKSSLTSTVNELSVIYKFPDLFYQSICYTLLLRFIICFSN